MVMVLLHGHSDNKRQVRVSAKKALSYLPSSDSQASTWGKRTPAANTESK